jgi:hypothetical protein
VQRAYLASTRLLSAVLLVLGAAMVVSAVAGGGGALALGVVLGAMFVLIGAARLWLGRRGEARSSRLGRLRRVREARSSRLGRLRRVRYPRGGER